jgi:hypothetical protein
MFHVNKRRMEELQTVGMVSKGKFFPLEKKNSVGVTEIAMVEAASPTPMNLDQYEGKVIMISGQDGGDTIYNAKIMDVANPILSVIAMKVFNKSLV